jgi:hypothetical protein
MELLGKYRVHVIAYSPEELRGGVGKVKELQSPIVTSHSR